jgi:SAM-dependent methyltransferase
MDSLDNEQKIQEDLYEFPYHHIPRFLNENFSAIRSHRGAHEYLGYVGFLISKIKKIPFSNLLDVGCGDGKLLFELSSQITDKKYFGIDFSERAILFARAFSPNIQFICGDITKENLEKCDIITLIETLEHIQPNEVSTFLKAIHKNISKNGRLIITVPSINEPLSPKHYQHFDLELLRSILDPLFTITESGFLNKKSRIFKSILVNRFFALNYRPFLNKMFRSYIKNSLIANEQNARRIFVICKPNVVGIE